MQVSLGDFYIRMPQYFFKEQNIYTLFQQVRGKAVPQAMKS